MEADTLNLTRLFELNRRYVVPLYQRPYVWKRDTHWKPLWDDVEGVAERVLRGETPKAHFLGAVVLEQVPTPAAEVEARLVIDGQQRLTTLQLLLEAFADTCAARGYEKIQYKVRKLTRNDREYTEDEDEQFKVWPTAVDQGQFRLVMLHENAEQVRADFSSADDYRLAGAFLFFAEVIEEWLDLGEGAAAARAEALYRTLRELLRVVVIDLASDDDAQAIFETLNARGAPLLPSDLVKNVLLQRARADGADVDAAYHKHWKPFDDQEKYWRQNVGRGHARRPKIDIFLQHYLTLRGRREIAVAHLYSEYRVHLRSSETSAIAHLEDLATYADVYASLDSLAASSKERLFMERIRTLEVGTAFPLLLELFHRRRKRQLDILPVLNALESFLVRRMVCHLNTRGYNRFFIDLLQALDGPDDQLAQRVTSDLLAGTADSNRWPSDEEFRRAWLDEPIYERQPQARVRLILEALERQLHSRHTERVEFGEALTIEHVMPQEWRANWPLSASATSETALDRDRAVQRLGNLTLVTCSLNPSLSNGAWRAKRESLDEHTLLMLNRPIIAKDDWDEAAIRARGESLFDTALQIWPRPVSDAATSPEPSSARRRAPSHAAAALSKVRTPRVRAGTELDGDFARRAFTKALIEDCVFRTIVNARIGAT